MQERSAAYRSAARSVRTKTAPPVNAVRKVWKRTEKPRTSAAGKIGDLNTVRKEFPQNATGRWSFAWAAVAGWAVGPQTLLALYDRIALTVGSGMPRSSYLENGGPPTAWGFLHGPGRWTRDTTAMAWETGQTSRFLICVMIGVLPVIGARVASMLDGSPTAKKWATVFVYGLPLAWICLPSYVSFAGYRAWWEVYLTTLTALAWWGWRTAKTMEPGFLWFLLMIPACSFVTGAAMYSPGAVF